MDGRHVVFGKVLSGMDVVYKIEAEGKQSGTPKSKVVIADSGELPLWCGFDYVPFLLLDLLFNIYVMLVICLIYSRVDFYVETSFLNLKF